MKFSAVHVFITWFSLAILAGCAPVGQATVQYSLSTQSVTDSSPLPTVTRTPFQPSAATPTLVPTPLPAVSIWVNPSVPAPIQEVFTLSENLLPRSNETSNQAVLDNARETIPGRAVLASLDWIYALVAPFPTITDNASLDALRQTWQGDAQSPFSDTLILVAPGTRAVMNSILGPAGETVQETEAGALLETAWQAGDAWAIIPFEELEPRWKVIRVDGTSPLERTFSSETYPLRVNFQLEVPYEQVDRYRKIFEQAGLMDQLPRSNRDPDKMTILVMTGVTALVRATAWTMETRGITFPGRDIGDLLRSADVTHISNEVSFNPDCPPPDPNPGNLSFCSDPDYFELLTDIGTDVVELSGNHVNDWGTQAFLFSLDMYKNNQMGYFAGGANLDEAYQPLIIEDHGNQMAFIGCNSAGPAGAWARESSPGSAPCNDYKWMLSEIAHLRDQGIIPIVTFQYAESYFYKPMPSQVRDFQAAAEAGAEIVNGSQAHFPQTFEFYVGSLIHYGLGNLFFDQINVPGFGEGTRWEFIDRHILYAGRHISTEVFTAYLEDWARPRWMTPQEREDFLKIIFTNSGW